MHAMADKLAHTASRAAAQASPSRSMRCRSCAAPLHRSFVDLGMTPPCESLVTAAQLHEMERFYPLHAYVCEACYLVQLQELVTPHEIFSEYAYFSSYADSWVAHAARYVDMAIGRFGLTPRHRVVEVASNDGYLLRHFVAAGIPVLGIEPAANVAAKAQAEGVPTRVAFFGTSLARQLLRQQGPADLLVGNNVLAHVPDLNDFVAGLALLLAPDGVLTMEFPTLRRLMEGNQFDTIYHEHFSYFSFLSAEAVFERHGLALFDVEELTTHGGSIRIYAHHAASQAHAVSPRVAQMRDSEVLDGFRRIEHYGGFARQVHDTKRRLLRFLIDAKAQGKSIAAYGAPGKGNTLLNYCGIRTDFIDFAVDANPYKHGKFTPGTHIPIHPPEHLREKRPDYVLILPWNLRDEIVKKAAFVREWGARFVVPIPDVEVFA